MSDPKMVTNAARNLEVLGNYMQELAEGAAANGHLPSVGDILGQRIDRMRLWQDDKNGRFKVKEVALPKLPVSTVAFQATPGEKRSAPLDTDLVTVLDQISDPEIAVDLTLDMDSGTVSLDVEVEPALVGKDLASLGKSKDAVSTPEFDDVDFEDAYWTAEEAARALGTVKSTITRRIRANELIGFRLFKNALHIPKEQVEGKIPMQGIPQMLALFDDDHYATWAFMTSAVFYGSSYRRPIDKLKAAKPAELAACLDEIKLAKEGFDYGDHG